MTDVVGTATVMFTDLVGSTALRARVGEEGAEVLRTLHDAILTEAITAHNGRVVKHLGDGMMATFTSSAQAVGAAVSLQQAIDRAGRVPGAERMEIRVGISVGDVTREGDDVFGLPVVEAQRLEASAAPATIRCAELVMQMARGRGGHEFRPLGDLTLKGLVEPLAACEVVWTPLPDAAATVTRAALSPVLAGTGLPFSGRSDEFAVLTDKWGQCATGGFEVVFLAGEPGVGKTRLAQELAKQVQDAKGVVLAGRSDEDVAVPFQAFGTALEWFVRHGPSVDTSTALARLGEFPGDLVRLVPHLGDLVPGLPPVFKDQPESERFRLFQAVESWLSVGGADEPRLLVIDDLHWADKPTLLLLKQLITNRPAGLMILCTYRDTDVGRAHALSAMLADFRRMDSVTRIAVDGLGAEGVRELLTRTGGHDLDETEIKFAELVHAETSGNPFFVSEVLRHFTDTGVLTQRDGRWTSNTRAEDTSIPEGIREVVGRRLGRLGEDGELVLRAAAVIGYEFDVDLLAAVVNKRADDVLDALDIARSAGLVIEVGVDRHRFAHALVRETLHSELSSSRRARQHRKVALALEVRHANGLDAVVTELATHWAEASAGGDPSRAIELAIRAGDVAVERGGHENAASWYSNALELMEEDANHGRTKRQTLVKLGTVESESGLTVEGRRHALSAAQAAIDAGDAETAAAALQVSARMSFGGFETPDPERVALLRRSLMMTALTDFDRVVLVGGLATELIFERDIAGRNAALAEYEVLIARLEPEVRAELRERPGSKRFAGDRSHIATHLRDLGEQVSRKSRPTDRVLAGAGLYFAALGIGDRSTADATLRSLRAEANHAARIATSFVHVLESMDCTIAGDIAGGESSAREMHAVMSALGLPEADVYRTTTTLANARERGTIGGLTRLAAALALIGHPAGTSRAIAAYIRFVAGHTDEILPALDRLDGEEFSDDAGYWTTVGYWSEIVVGMGNVDQRRRFVGLLTPKTNVNMLTGGIYLGPVDRVLALLHDALGEQDRADEYFASAVELQIATVSPPWIARCHLDWAESLLNRGQPDRASDCLDAAAVAIGTLDLPDNQRRHAELTARRGR